MISTLRSQVGFAAAVAHARLRLSRLELIGGSGWAHRRPTYQTLATPRYCGRPGAALGFLSGLGRPFE